MSPRTPLQFKEMREEKMILIMNVALEHFANEGYYRTPISHIARHAGISKGLMYNYFDSKEALLKAIIHKSVNEVYSNLDVNHNGYLTEEEFEDFIRRFYALLKEKRYFWRLLMQLIMQNDVREQFLKAFPESDSLIHPGHIPGDNFYPLQMLKMITGYFAGKKDKMGMTYDPQVEMNMFLITLKGFAVTCIYMDNTEDENNEKTINRIIELFK